MTVRRVLTTRQHELLRYLRDHEDASFDEIATALGLKSKSGVHRMLGELEERGFVRRIPKRRRAIEVIRDAR